MIEYLNTYLCVIICYALLDDDGTRKESWNTNCLIEPVSMKNKKQRQSKTADIYALVENLNIRKPIYSFP